MLTHRVIVLTFWLMDPSEHARASCDPFRTLLAEPDRDDARSTLAPRSSRAPGMHLGHDLLLAVTMAIAFAMLGATTWLWTLR